MKLSDLDTEVRNEIMENSIEDMLDLYSGIEELEWILNNPTIFMAKVRVELKNKLEGEAELSIADEHVFPNPWL